MVPGGAVTKGDFKFAKRKVKIIMDNPEIRSEMREAGSEKKTEKAKKEEKPEKSEEQPKETEEGETVKKEDIPF